MAETTRQSECNATRTLYVAFELSGKMWRLAVTTDRGERPRHYSVASGDLGAVQERLARARTLWGLPAATRVVSCYEAGREGFWLHRALTAQGFRNVVVDATSIERDRRAKAVKTDRVDAERLLELLVAWTEGRKRLRTVRVPSVADEDARHADRELATLKGVRTTLVNRITGLLGAQGIPLRLTPARRVDVAALRDWAGAPLGPGLAGRLTRELAELAAVRARIAGLEQARQTAITTAATPATAQMAQLVQLRGIGANGASRVVVEFFAWRGFRNGREVGALAGLTPTPYQSGAVAREQGISKAGNARVRSMVIELAWCWLRFQPQSALAQWYQARFGAGGRRQRRIGIVALARKLLIALWRYLDAGVVPDGAIVTAAA
jgi:transposase